MPSRRHQQRCLQQRKALFHEPDERQTWKAAAMPLPLSSMACAAAMLSLRCPLMMILPHGSPPYESHPPHPPPPSPMLSSPENPWSSIKTIQLTMTFRSVLRLWNCACVYLFVGCSTPLPQRCDHHECRREESCCSKGRRGPELHAWGRADRAEAGRKARFAQCRRGAFEGSHRV